MEKTTRKPQMKKAVAEAKTREELVALAVKFWNELALGYCIEHKELALQSDGSYNCEENTFHVADVSDVYEEALYWLSCYYESGNIRHDDEHHDRHAFLKFVEVFRPYVGDVGPVASYWGIPRKPENEFLFRMA